VPGPGGPRKGKHDVASTVRGAFLRAVESLDSDYTTEDGERMKAMPLSTIMEKLLRERPEVALNAVAKFVPQKMLVEYTIMDQLEEMSDEAIEHEIGRLAGEAGPVLTALRAQSSAEH